jgi:6-phosphogluconolactonase
MRILAPTVHSSRAHDRDETEETGVTVPTFSRQIMNRRSLIGAIAATIVAACADDPVTAPLGTDLTTTDVRVATTTGRVYTMTNSTSGNEVLVFARAANGALTPAGVVATGGNGLGAGLGNQGGVTLSPDRRWLAAVNAGSNDVSLFAVAGDGSLTLTDRIASGGTLPVSVTLRGRHLYVVNEGTANIAGFDIGTTGSLTSIAGSTRPLSTAGVDVAQIQFSPDGRWLVVTEKSTNVLDVYRVSGTGSAAGPVVNASSGITPFGFAFTNGGAIIVSEAFGGAVDGSAASSYTIRRDGTIETLSGSIATTETAACWFVVTGDNRFAYTTNAGSGTVTGYAIQRGRLVRLAADGVSGMVGAGTSPSDLAVSDGSRYLYTRNGGAQSITAFAVKKDGSLERLPHAVTGLPATANGLAGF